eukprot:169155-Pleurochrysis_carterae.AAC.7
MSSPAPAQQLVTPAHHPRGRWTTRGREAGETSDPPPDWVGGKWGESPRKLRSDDQERTCSSLRGALTPAPQSGGWLAQELPREPLRRPHSRRGACAVGARA